MSIATMNNYEDFQATLLQLAQDPSTDTELFTRLFLAYKEHVSLKEATTHLAKMMIKEEPPGGEQEPKTPTSTPPLIDDKPHTPGVSFVKATGKYRATKWTSADAEKAVVHLGFYDTVAEAELAVAAYIADGTIKLPVKEVKTVKKEKHTSIYKGVSFAYEKAKWVANRETGFESGIEGKLYIGAFIVESEAAKAVKKTGSFKEFYDSNFPDL